MSFQMPASPAGSTPYQGASSPCICPYASYDQQIRDIGRAHIEVVALTAVKLLVSGEAETKKLLRICPFRGCKEGDYADSRALVDHIINCEFSSDAIYCVDCNRYKSTTALEKEPAHLERDGAHSERDTSGRMDIRKPLRKFSNFIQASIRSSHSSASSSRAGSMVSAESPRSSRDFASPRLEESHPAPLPPQTHLYELTDSPIGELGDTSLPFEIGGVETRPVHHPSELAVHVAEAPRHQLLGHTMDPMQRPGPQRRQCRMSPSPPPLQTNHTIPISHAGHNVHGNWIGECHLSMTNGSSFLGNDITESPIDMQPEVFANFGVFRGFTPGAGMGETVSSFGSIDVSPSSSRGHGYESMLSALEPLTHASFGSAGSPSNIQHRSLGGNVHMRREPSELAAPAPVQMPLLCDSQLSQERSTMDAVPLVLRDHPWHQAQPRTFSGSTSTSTGTMESTGTNSSATLELMSPARRAPIAGFPNRAQILRRRSSVNPRSSQWRCRHKGCDYQPAGNVEKNWPSYLRKHQKKHNPEFLPCPKCGNLLRRKDNLKTHLKNSCKGFLHRMVEHSSPDVLDVMSMDDSEAWVDSQLSIPEEEDGLLWPLELHQ